MTLIDARLLRGAHRATATPVGDGDGKIRVGEDTALDGVATYPVAAQTGAVHQQQCRRGEPYPVGAGLSKPRQIGGVGLPERPEKLRQRFCAQFDCRPDATVHARCWPTPPGFARHSPGERRFVDETYVKVTGVWRYVYRAVDQDGQVIDVLVSARRDAAEAPPVVASSGHHASESLSAIA
jgi:DDE domain